MFPPPTSQLPPYSSTSSATASTSLPVSASAPANPGPTYRKTVRFQTTNDATKSINKQGPNGSVPGSNLPLAGAGARASNGYHASATSSPPLAAVGSALPSNYNGNGTAHHQTSYNTNHNNNGGGGGTLGSGPPSYDGGDIDRGSSSSGGGGDGQVARPSLLQPRVAVVLGLPSLWHLPLFACRSLSVCPAIWWSLGIFIRLLAQLHALAVARGVFGEVDPSSGSAGGGFGSSVPGVDAIAAAAPGGLGNLPDRGVGLSLESRLKLTETALAMIWATIVRLLAINALNGYLTSWVIYLMGSGGDSRLLLPAWVAIAAILTGLYHGTQRKINIRKETSISISVFSGASFISMVSLLAQLYWDRPEYVDVPVVALTRRVCTEAARIAGNLFDIGNITMDL
ncbi:uncharacterized protein SPSK_06284 [Sporothrix schenckii 1099-18]|uniref:N-glycosylation protein EOS1 n=1 Tax=Sporothrix schenckii 1099-18 TaxID=1397361 RepID=A0A0F2MMV3_SPOSC|nr:uncharacterized protein SPSK_06284 [Sporothrix schenckii 1099-18]KJR89501.1 hypothetical protein SPSK_06284 [Sporothrix schenckii 1099-18]